MVICIVRALTRALIFCNAYSEGGVYMARVMDFALEDKYFLIRAKAGDL